MSSKKLIGFVSSRNGHTYFVSSDMNITDNNLYCWHFIGSDLVDSEIAICKGSLPKTPKYKIVASTSNLDTPNCLIPMEFTQEYHHALKNGIYDTIDIIGEFNGESPITSGNTWFEYEIISHEEKQTAISDLMNMELTTGNDNDEKVIDSPVLPNIAQLYYRYKSASDEKIKQILDNVKIVKLSHKEPGSVYGYYTLDENSHKKIYNKPRNVSLTFDATTLSNNMMNLEPYKTFTFLVKSSSRFFLKPDFGEIIDQLEFDDYDTKLKAIMMNDGYETLEGTEGEHHLMTATLLKFKK